jgi:hypothetical protein
MIDIKPASPEVESCYQSMVEHLAELSRRHPDMRNVEIIAVLAKTVGYCIAMCEPDERDLARAMAIANIDGAAREVAQTIGGAAGHA